MKIIVTDASVLIDLERGVLLQAAFRLPFIWIVPDLLYERELKPFNGPELVNMGLHVMRLSSAAVELAIAYQQRSRHLSIRDAYALALAKLGGQTIMGDALVPDTGGEHPLLVGDRRLREIAVTEGVECRGLLWVFDEIEAAGILAPADLELALSAISAHKKARLPTHEVTLRIVRYRQRK